MEERQEPQVTGEPVTERARIAGVEAGIAAGLVRRRSLSALDRGASRRPECRSVDAMPPACRAPRSDRGTVASARRQLASLRLRAPDWTDPPTLQVPRVLLDLEQEAAAERGARRLRRPGTGVARASGGLERHRRRPRRLSPGLRVTAYEESSSDDPFAYDFLDLDDESSWVAR